MDRDAAPRDLPWAMRRHALPTAALVLAGAGAGLALVLASPPRFTSEAFVILPAPITAVSAGVDPLASLGNAVPSAATVVQIAQGIAGGLVADAAPGATGESLVDEKRGVLVVRMTAASSEAAAADAAKVARHGSEALAKALSAAVHTQFAAVLGPLRLESAHARRAALAARALADRTPVRKGSPAAGVPEALESDGTKPAVARSADPGAAWLRLQVARFELQAGLLEARVSGLEDLDRDPAPVLALMGLGGGATPSFAARPATARPRSFARATAAGAVLGLFAALAVVFYREAAAAPPPG